MISLILIITLAIIAAGIFRCEAFKCLRSEGFSSTPYYFPRGLNEKPMFPDMNPGMDTFARYCYNRNGDCEFGHKFCTCLEHGGCGWWAGEDGKAVWTEFGHVLPCSRFNRKCTSIGYS